MHSTIFIFIVLQLLEISLTLTSIIYAIPVTNNAVLFSKHKLCTDRRVTFYSYKNMKLSAKSSDNELKQTTIRWVKKWVIEYGLCPWALGVFKSPNTLKISVIRSSKSSMLKTKSELFVANQIFSHIIQMKNPENAHVTTELIILPELSRFEDFLSIHNRVEKRLEKERLNYYFQLATFHPDYVFMGAKAGDVENYTNRSPYPMIHLLRVEEVRKEIAKHNGNTDFVWKKNIKTLQDMGLQRVCNVQANILSSMDKKNMDSKN